MKKREKIYIFDTKILTGGLFHGKNLISYLRI